MPIDLQYRLVMRQAEAFVRLVQDTIECATPAGLQAVHEPEGLRFPEVKVVGRTVFWGDCRLPLGRCPLTLRLFELFCAAPEGRLTREELIVALYGKLPSGDSSTRYRAAIFHNLVKLISRARKQATLSLVSTEPVVVNWFTHDPLEGVWHLYTVRGKGVRQGAIHLFGGRGLERAGQAAAYLE